jgi:hypothetical protein
MKKIIASAVGLMLAGGIAATAASAAVENQFGGYWRTRSYYQDQFQQKDDNPWVTDNRTRLYYTAKFNDDFKFVNKFEFNTKWGDTNGGDIGADGTSIWRIKNSYADFNVGNVNAKLGIQAATIARGFIFDDDFSGAMVTMKFGNVSVPLFYAAVQEEDANTATATASFTDARIAGGLVSVKVSDAITVTPYFVWYGIDTVESTDLWYLGADADLKFGSVSVWGTAIYNGGEVEGADNQAFLGAVGVDAGIVHGQAFYATGDDSDADQNAFVSAPATLKNGAVTSVLSPGYGSSYYWAEIMGLGVFDNTANASSPGDDISNIWAANAGVTIKPMDKLKVSADVWYAALAEDNAAGDTDLGVEFDGNVGYNIFDNLTAEAIFAYLIAGDATGDEDIIETGVRFSLKF